MQIVKDRSDLELYQSLIAELAKAQNEIACARGDLDKATSRLKFVLMVVNELKDRKEQR